MLAGDLLQLQHASYYSAGFAYNDVCKQQAKVLYKALLRRGKSIPLQEVLCTVQNLTRARLAGSNKVLEYAIAEMPNLFEVKFSGGQHVVAALVTVQFCRDFETKNGCLRKRCPCLHVCRHYVKDKCTFGARCKKPHHFRGEHATSLLRENLLDGMDEVEVKTILCRYVQFTLDDTNLTPPKYLQVCQYYNVKIGCSRGDSCPYLHVCKFYATSGVCKFGNDCIRSHGFHTIHCQKLLQHYGITERDARRFLATSTVCVGGGGSSGDGGGSPTQEMSGSIESDVVTPASRVNLDFDDDLVNTICSYYLKGKCYCGNECLAIHSKQLYVWQVKRDDDRHWRSLNEDINIQIEQCYCKPEIEGCIGKEKGVSPILVIDFMRNRAVELDDTDRLPTSPDTEASQKNTVHPLSTAEFDILSLKGQGVKVRRLSTVSKANASSGEVFATTWHLYIKDENCNWKRVRNTDRNYFEQLHNVHNGCHGSTFPGSKQDGPQSQIRPEFMDIEIAKQHYEWYCNERVTLLLHGVGFPNHWRVEKDPTLEFVQVPLEPSDHLYIRLCEWISESMSDIAIIKITLVQNVDLWKDYKRGTLEESGKKLKEELLFIGTTSRKIRSTYQQGFANDKRAAEANNTPYCNELSRHPLMADVTATEDSRGYRHMFIARVLMEDQSTHTTGQRQHESHSDIYAKPKVNLPESFIIPVTKKNRLYPEFLVTYIHH